MSQTIMFIVALAVILALVVLILILKKRLDIVKQDNETIRQYNKEMDKIRTERRREAEKKKTYYTTYNERDNMTATEKYELAHYAKKRFPKKK